MQCSSFLTAREAIAAGLGVGLLPVFYGRGYQSLVLLEHSIKGADNDLWILTHRDLKNTARIRAFMDFAYEEIQELQCCLSDE